MASRDFSIVRVGDINDAAAPLEFYPPKGSDELHDALKKAYPHLPNLQSRMREAVIEFYLKEQSADEDFSTQFTPDMMGSNFIPSPDCSFSASAADTIYTPPTADEASSSAQTPSSIAPSQQDLMNVWTLPTSTQAKIHKRRNMTAEEKVKYKAKRLTGACEDCRRRRRKCEHDRSQLTQNVSIITPAKSSQKKACRSTGSRTLSAKPVPAPVVFPNATPPPQPQFEFDDDMFFASNSFGIHDPFSMEMTAIDPSMLSLESPFGYDTGLDIPFDLSQDFELSPFLTSLPQLDRDFTGHDPFPGRLPRLPSSGVLPSSGLLPSRNVLPSSGLLPSRNVLPSSDLLPSRSVVPSSDLLPSGDLLLPREVLPSGDALSSRGVLPSGYLRQSDGLLAFSGLLPIRGLFSSLLHGEALSVAHRPLVWIKEKQKVHEDTALRLIEQCLSIVRNSAGGFLDGIVTSFPSLVRLAC